MTEDDRTTELTDEDITTVMGGTGTAAPVRSKTTDTDGTDADGTDDDGTDGTDGDSGDTDGTDGVTVGA